MQFSSLEIAPENSRFVVTGVGDGQDSVVRRVEKVDMYPVTVGDQLLAVNGEPLATVTLAQVSFWV